MTIFIPFQQNKENLIHKASSGGHLDIVKYILEELESETSKILTFDVDVKDAVRDNSHILVQLLC